MIRSIIALISASFGWKYVLNDVEGKFHHYKCPKIKEFHLRKKYGFASMVDDMEENNTKLCKCVGKEFNINLTET